MGTTDPRIDAYIAKAPEFARPILTHLREVVHAACPDVEEQTKWSSPHFTYRGMLCHMAAFKEHCAFGFWKGSLFLDGERAESGAAMGQFGRITSLAELPSDEVLTEYIHRAMRVNEEGLKTPTRSKAAGPKPEAVPPDDLEAALSENESARAGYERLSPSQRREYVEWLEEAKTGATRAKRLATAVEWMAEGKSRHWKYARP
jgi:uncharacterized protein YdeI (YjbR/CyaY-like superfamily)